MICPTIVLPTMPAGLTEPALAFGPTASGRVRMAIEHVDRGDRAALQ